MPFTLRSNTDHVARIQYTPGTLNVYVGDTALPATPTATYSVDLTNIGGASILDGAGAGYIGFTSSTGGSNDNHIINSWNFTPVPEPTGLLAGAVGVAGLSRFGRRRFV